MHGVQFSCCTDALDGEILCCPFVITPGANSHPALVMPLLFGRYRDIAF